MCHDLRPFAVPSRGARRPATAGRLALTLATAASLAATAGCGSGSHAGSPSAAGTDGPAVSITTSERQQPTFADVETAVSNLYRDHPSITAFSTQDVQYNPITRDKVLQVCRRGGPEKDAAARESARIAGCAPLIFFFYNYGQHAAAPDAYDVAEKVYWYASTSIKGPLDARQSLNTLLKGWGIS